jgi:hypothetical protein
MTKAAVIISAILLLAGVAAASTVTGGLPSSDSPSVSIPDGSPSNSLSTSTGTDTTPTVGTTTGEDVSGPCDEAEHASDPRCIGVAGAPRDDDRRGPNRGPGRGDDDRRDDNSGPGSAHDRNSNEGNSGRGGGDNSDD